MILVQFNILSCNCNINKTGEYCEDDRDICAVGGYCYPGVPCELDGVGMATCGDCPQHYDYVTTGNELPVCRGKLQLPYVEVGYIYPYVVVGCDYPYIEVGWHYPYV